MAVGRRRRAPAQTWAGAAGAAPSRPPHALLLAAIAAATALAYANSFDAGFVLDSRAIILENPALRAATGDNVAALLTRDYWQPHATGGLYRPLTSLSYLADYAVLGHGTHPFGYHAANLLLHLACVAAAYALYWHLGRDAWPAALAAALFALHPVATEAVTNIVGRADLLAALGVLGGLLCHLRVRHARGARRAAWLAALAAAAAVACFAKENGVVLLALIAFYDAVAPANDDGRGKGWPSYVVLVPVIAAYLAARAWVQSGGLPAESIAALDNPLVEAGFVAGRLTALEVVGRGLLQLAWPATLSADYSYAEIPVLAWPPGVTAVAAFAALGVAAAVAARFRRRDRALLFLVGFYFVALLPVSNLIVLIGTIRAERLLYLPLVGFAGAVARLAARAAGERRLAAGVLAGLVLVLCGWRTAARNRDWADEATLWAATVRAAPASAKARKAYAKTLFDGRAGAEAAGIDAAIREAERALEIRADYRGALVDLGSYYLAKGDSLAAGAAEEWYAESVAVLERARRLEAEAHGRHAAEMAARGIGPAERPRFGDPLLYNNLSLAYVRLGRFEQALEAYEASRRLQPTEARHYVDLSAVLANLGRFDEAAVALWQAMALQAGHAEAGARLLQLYRHIDPETAAVGADGAGGLRLDLDHLEVRAHRCRAHRELADALRRSGEIAAAARAGEAAGAICPAAVSPPG